MWPLLRRRLRAANREEACKVSAIDDAPRGVG